MFVPDTAQDARFAFFSARASSSSSRTVFLPARTRSNASCNKRFSPNLTWTAIRCLLLRSCLLMSDSSCSAEVGYCPNLVLNAFSKTVSYMTVPRFLFGSRLFRAFRKAFVCSSSSDETSRSTGGWVNVPYDDGSPASRSMTKNSSSSESSFLSTSPLTDVSAYLYECWQMTRKFLLQRPR